jgi:glycosyltransferase involved in cell wall biosynthesis
MSPDEEYIFVGDRQGGEWLRRYVENGMRFVTPPPPPGQCVETIKNLFGPLRKPLGIARRALRSSFQIKAHGIQNIALPVSDGFYESLAPNVLHITYPLNFVLSSIPTAITMHDLQHRHFPEFFPPNVMKWREATYPKMFDFAQAIITISQFCKDDIIKQYGVPSSKIFVVRHAAPTKAYPPGSKLDQHAVIRKYDLPTKFMLYPAMTYGHKNHLMLLEAMALLRGQGRAITLVCTGAQRHHWPAIEKRMRQLKIESQVRFVGFVSTAELTALYQLAQFVVLPSLFEGAGLPLLEAFRAKKPVACSDIAAFREYGAEAPLYFDPFDAESIGQAIQAMADSIELRTALAARGVEREAEFSWSRAAKLYRAVYRKVAGRQLSSEENRMLNETVQ